MKKFLFISTLVAMSIGCIGCGSNNDTTNGVSNGAPTTNLENSMINGMPANNTQNNVTGDTIGTNESVGTTNNTPANTGTSITNNSTNDSSNINGNPVAEDHRVTAPNHSDTVASSANGNTLNDNIDGIVSNN